MLLPVYEVSGKSVTFQNQSICASMADGWEAQRRKRNSVKHHAGYRAGLGLEAGQRDTYFCALSVYFCTTSTVNTVIQRRNHIFKIEDFSSHKGQGIHRKQTVKTSTCACYYTVQTCLTALYRSRKASL